jgi:hypothetical protein
VRRFTSFIHPFHYFPRIHPFLPLIRFGSIRFQPSGYIHPVFIISQNGSIRSAIDRFGSVFKLVASSIRFHYFPKTDPSVSIDPFFFDPSVFNLQASSIGFHYFPKWIHPS